MLEIGQDLCCQLLRTTEGYEGKAAEEKLEICIERLRAEFGESREDKCRRLAAELSVIQQERSKSVEQFAFKYKKLLHQLEKLGEKIATDFLTFVILQFISKVSPDIAQQFVVKASEFETLDKTFEAARRVELLFQTPPTSANVSKSLVECKVTPNAFVCSTAAVKPQLPNQHPQRQQRACYTCGDTNHLSRYCPKNRKENSKQPEICRNYNRFQSPTAKKMATNASTAGNTSVNSAIKGAQCEAIKHPENRPSSRARSTTSDEVDSLRQ